MCFFLLPINTNQTKVLQTTEMLLQPITPRVSLTFHNQNTILNSLSFSNGILQNSRVYLKQPIISISNITHKATVFITCSSISQVHSYGTVDFEKRPLQKWNSIYTKISMLKDPKMGSASVLNQAENEGKRISKWEICRTVKELRKFGRFRYALEVYEWMNNRPERYRLTTSDTAIQLDLIAKVHGITSAEQYFRKLPEALKDKRIYGSLLNVYVRARMKEKAESLMDKMRSRGFASHALPFNVMMTLYMNLKDHEKLESIITELKEKKIPLDIYSYNIWLSSQGSIDKMEHVFEQMQQDSSINPNWTTFSTMATMYIKFDQIIKAEEYLRKVEGRITGRDRMPYHYLISLYASAGNKEEIYRVWKIYKGNFINIPNLGYHTVISALLRTNEIEGAEKLYNEWLSVKKTYDARVGNLLLSSYVRNGLSEKARTFFDQLIEVEGKPNSVTWEILAEDHIRNMRIPDALSCLNNAASAEGSKSWKPKSTNLALILRISEQNGDVAMKDAVIEVLRHVGCLDDAVYMSGIPVNGGGTFAGSVQVEGDRLHGDDESEVDYVLVEQLQEC